MNDKSTSLLLTIAIDVLYAIRDFSVIGLFLSMLFVLMILVGVK